MSDKESLRLMSPKLAKNADAGTTTFPALAFELLRGSSDSVTP